MEKTKKYCYYRILCMGLLPPYNQLYQFQGTNSYHVALTSFIMTIVSFKYNKIEQLD